MSADPQERPALINPLGQTQEAGDGHFAIDDELRAPDDLVGKKVGQYLIERKLGEGGMGVVYQGVHESLGQQVAIKLLHGRLGNDNKTAKRFFNEARAISIVRHPGLVNIHHYEQLPDGTAYLVMEFLQGESLEARLEKLRPRGARLPIDKVKEIGRQVASALAAAHESDIVHCDLKPDNIFLCPDLAAAGGERIKVLDFGIAKFLAESGGKKTTAGLVLGTPRYMSPEQCEGRDKVDSKVDVYSLGVILYEMLGGLPPFEAATSAALMRQHMVKEPPPLASRAPDVPDGLQRLVTDMLAKDGSARPGMTEVLARLAGGAAPERAPRRRPAALAAALVAAALGIAGGAWYVLHRPPPRAPLARPAAAPDPAPGPAVAAPPVAPPVTPPAGALKGASDGEERRPDGPIRSKRRPPRPRRDEPAQAPAGSPLKIDIFGK